MPLYNEDHQATLLEKGTFSLVLFTKLKQKLQICKQFVNAVRKNSSDIVLLALSDTPSSE